MTHMTKKLTLKNIAPFTFCILKINSTLIDNAENLDIVMTIYNLFEYSKNYKKETTRILCSYYRDEPNEESVGGGNGAIKNSIRNSKYFDYEKSITGKLEGSKTEKEAEIVASLKCLSNFWRTPHMPLTNCEINLILTWSENCVLRSKATRDKFIGSGTNENSQFSEIDKSNKCKI